MQASPDALVHHARLLGAMATNWIGALLCIAPSAQFGHWLFRTLANSAFSARSAPLTRAQLSFTNPQSFTR